VDVAKTSEVIELEKAAAQVMQRIQAEPVYRAPLYKLLAFCTTARTAAEVESELAALPQMRTALHPPHVLLAWLENSGGLERLAAGQEIQWHTTRAGKRALDKLAPAKQLLELFAAESKYRDLYIEVLRFCDTPRTKGEIENLLQGNPVMEDPKVYPVFLIQGLEAAGGLEWDGKWCATEAAKGVSR